MARSPSTSSSPSSSSGAVRPSALNTALNLAQPDEVYQALIDLHQGLTREQSELVNARLILLLANHVGDAQVLSEAMRHARLAAVQGD